MEPVRLIDVHHHLLPPDYVEAVGASSIARQGSSGRVPAWSVADALQRMDAAGIQTAITSISAPGVGPLGPTPGAVRVSRTCNDFAAEMATAHLGRFGFFATLPLPQVDAALTEIAYAFDTLAADGVCLLSNYRGRYVGAPEFSPILEELDRRAAVVFLHPDAPETMPDLVGLSPSTLEFPFDTTRAVASLLVSGALRRYARIRFVLGHAGGAMPFLFRRVATLARNNKALAEQFPDGIAPDLRGLFADTTLATSDSQLNALTDMIPAANMLFGSDYPFGPPAQMGEAAGAVAKPWEGGTQLAQVLRENALRLFPRFDDRPTPVHATESGRSTASRP
jgi:predicted TIM-barrel fold metal-dependent hydrolase